MILMPIFHNAGTQAYRSRCQSNLKQITLGLLQYTQDWDEKFPPIQIHDAVINEERPLGWADAIFLYTKSNQILWCPIRLENKERDGNDRKPHEAEFTDYWFNQRLASFVFSKVKVSANTFILGEGNDGTDATNARYSLSTLPEAWRKNKKSPAFRHLEGANYAFVDGHIKWLKPQKVTNSKPNGNHYTFAIK